jgi:hypothetical protein
MQTGEDPLGARSTAGAGVQTALPTFDGSATQLRVFNRFNLEPWVRLYIGLRACYEPRACPAGATGLSPRIAAYRPFEAKSC